MSKFKTKAGTELPIISLKNKDYLEVKYRLVWFREEHPDYGIETEIIERNDKYAIAKATIKDTSGRILATAHKREDVAHFQDNIEKCETSAIGRALALVGYGTQFTGDELYEGERIVDAPVQRILASSPSNCFTFGKFAGLAFEDIGLVQLRDYVKYLVKTADESGKPLHSNIATSVQAAQAWIESVGAKTNDKKAFF